MKTKHLIFAIVCLLPAFGAEAQAKLEVTVKNIKEPKGSIRIGLFTSEKDFLKNAAHGKIVKASGDEVKVVFDDLAAGVYAVSVIHDENDNGTLDSNFVGMPTEGFGFGNNAMGMFGPPSFEKAKVTLSPGVSSQAINLKYL